MADTTSKPLPKALCIVEGADDEPRLLKRMSAVCGLDLEMEIVPVRSNIHQLYQILAEGDFLLDIRKVLADLATYKARVGQRKHASLNLSKYDTAAFRDLARMNICKIAALAGNDFATPSYADYMRQSTSSAIFTAQQTHVATDSRLGVLNTTVLLPVDYFGTSYYPYSQQHRSS